MSDDIIRAARTMARELPLSGCPTSCDPDCTADCHEAHAPGHMRAHEPGFQCGEAQILVAAARLAERERIAALADDMARQVPPFCHPDEGTIWTRMTAAEAIRGAYQHVASKIREDS